MIRRFQLAPMVLLAGLLALPAVAWGLVGQEARQEPPASQQEQEQQQSDTRRRNRGRNRAVSRMFGRLAAMTPAEREKFYETDESFARLSLEVQATIKRRMKEFDAMPVERQDAIRERLARQRRAREAEPSLFLAAVQVPPEEQKAWLEANPDFQALSPKSRQRLVEQLEHYNQLTPKEREQHIARLQRMQQMTPEQRRELARRARMWRNMSPEQREEARALYKAWRELPPDRQKVIQELLERFQNAAPDQRRALIESGELLEGLSEKERTTASGLLKLRQAMPRRGRRRGEPLPGNNK